MFRIKRSFTAMMMAAAMVFGTTAASAGKEDFDEDREEEVSKEETSKVEFTEVELTAKEKARAEASGDEIVKLETFSADGERVEATIEGGQAVLVYTGKEDLKGESMDDFVTHGWLGDVVKALFELAEVLTGGKSDGSGKGSGGSGDNSSGGSSSGCTTNITNNGGGTVIVHQTCGGPA